jgi:hypothetical protein
MVRQLANNEFKGRNRHNILLHPISNEEKNLVIYHFVTTLETNVGIIHLMAGSTRLFLFDEICRRLQTVTTGLHVDQIAHVDLCAWQTDQTALHVDQCFENTDQHDTIDHIIQKMILCNQYFVIVIDEFQDLYNDQLVDTEYAKRFICELNTIIDSNEGRFLCIVTGSSPILDHLCYKTLSDQSLMTRNYRQVQAINYTKLQQVSTVNQKHVMVINNL